jgi:hypothetical protein
MNAAKTDRKKGNPVLASNEGCRARCQGVESVDCFADAKQGLSMRSVFDDSRRGLLSRNRQISADHRRSFPVFNINVQYQQRTEIRTVHTQNRPAAEEVPMITSLYDTDSVIFPG